MTRSRLALAAVLLARPGAGTAGRGDDGGAGLGGRRSVVPQSAALALDRAVARRTGRRRRPAIRSTNSRSTRAPPAAGSGRPTTADSTGPTSPTASSRRGRSAPSPSRRPTRTSSTSAWARRASAATRRTATASTSRPTPARPGRTSGSRRPGRSAACRCIRPIPTSRTWRRSAMRGARIPTAASTARATAARTWQKVLFRNENAGAIDLVLDPSNPNVIYATTLELRRYPWGFRSAGPGTAIFKSTDGGDTWTDLSAKTGLPKGDKGRIGIALAPSRPNRVWAIIDAAGADQGIYRTDDGGETWTHLTDNADLTQRPWYYHHIFADPKNADVLWALNVDLWKSTDGGTTFAGGVGAARRQPRPVDRSAGSAADGRSQRRRRDRDLQRRQVVVDDPQPADGAALSRGRRQPGAVPRLRGAAGQHHHLGAEPLGPRPHHHRGMGNGGRRRGRLRRPAPHRTRTSSTRPITTGCTATTGAPSRCATSRPTPRRTTAGARPTSTSASGGPSR